MIFRGAGPVEAATRAEKVGIFITIDIHITGFHNVHREACLSR